MFLVGVSVTVESKTRCLLHVARVAERFAIANSLAEQYVPYQKKAIQSITRHLNGLLQH